MMWTVGVHERTGGWLSHWIKLSETSCFLPSVDTGKMRTRAPECGVSYNTSIWRTKAALYFCYDYLITEHLVLFSFST